MTCILCCVQQHLAKKVEPVIKVAAVAFALEQMALARDSGAVFLARGWGDRFGRRGGY
jgi:hypothetical protein